MYVVGKTNETTEESKYDNYEDAKAAYDKLIRCEQNKVRQHEYTKGERFFTENSKDESTVFTDNNIRVDGNDYNFCEVFLFYEEDK